MGWREVYIGETLGYIDPHLMLCFKQWFHQPSNGPVRTGTVQSSASPVQGIFGLWSDQSPIFRDLDWTGRDSFRPVDLGRIGPNTLGVTDSLSQQIDSYTYSHTCRLILPFTSHNTHLTLPHLLLATCHWPLPTCHPPVVWYGWVSRGGAC